MISAIRVVTSGTSGVVQFAAHDNGVAILANDFDQIGETCRSGHSCGIGRKVNPAS